MKIWFETLQLANVTVGHFIPDHKLSVSCAFHLSTDVPGSQILVQLERDKFPEPNPSLLLLLSRHFRTLPLLNYFVFGLYGFSIRPLCEAVDNCLNHQFSDKIVAIKLDSIYVLFDRIVWFSFSEIERTALYSNISVFSSFNKYSSWWQLFSVVTLASQMRKINDERLG